MLIEYFYLLISYNKLFKQNFYQSFRCKNALICRPITLFLKARALRRMSSDDDKNQCV